MPVWDDGAIFCRIIPRTIFLRACAVIDPPMQPGGNAAIADEES